jgi:HK97 family phage portal protein
MSRGGRKPSRFRGMVWRVGAAFRALAGQALPPWDDYWYQRPGVDSSSGMAVSPETSMRLSAVYSCIRVRSETLASLPLIVYRHLPDGGRERAQNHPLYSVLHDAPNQWQTSLEFVEMMQAHLDLRGNAFARIVPGPGRAIDQLIPLHPDLVQVYRLPNGRLKYSVRSRFEAEVDWYTQEEIFHLRGLSSDGLVGLSPIALQRETMGNGLAMDDYSGRFFLNGARPSGVLEYPGKFKDDSARQKFGESWRQAHVQENQHKVAVLEDGMKYTALGVSNADAQFIDSKKMNREEIAGIYRTPPHKIGILERSTNNNIEHQGIEFVTDCMRPIAVRWERRINSDLIQPLDLGDGNEYFAEFTLDGLLRGDMKSRYDAYQVGRNGGWLCPNDVCRFENLNPIPPEKGGDDYLRPINYAIAGAPDPAQSAQSMEQADALPASDPPPDVPDDSGSEGSDTPANAALLRAFAGEAARRVVRKEVTALRKELAKAAISNLGSEFDAAAKEFYEEHVPLISQTMCITAEAASDYVDKNLELLFMTANVFEKQSVIDWIEDTGPDRLAETALGTRPRVKGLLR